MAREIVVPTFKMPSVDNYSVDENLKTEMRAMVWYFATLLRKKSLALYDSITLTYTELKKEFSSSEVDPMFLVKHLEAAGVFERSDRTTQGSGYRFTEHFVLSCIVHLNEIHKGKGT